MMYGIISWRVTEHEEYEFIEVHKIPVRQLIENGRAGKMTDTAALFLAYESLKELL